MSVLYITEWSDALYNAQGNCHKAIQKFTQVKSIHGIAIMKLIELIILARLEQETHGDTEEIDDPDELLNDHDGKIMDCFDIFKSRISQLLAIDDKPIFKKTLEYVRANKDDFSKIDVYQVLEFLVMPVVSTNSEMFTDFDIKKKDKISLYMAQSHSVGGIMDGINIDVYLDEDQQKSLLGSQNSGDAGQGTGASPMVPDKSSIMNALLKKFMKINTPATGSTKSQSNEGEETKECSTEKIIVLVQRKAKTVEVEIQTESVQFTPPPIGTLFLEKQQMQEYSKMTSRPEVSRHIFNHGMDFSVNSERISTKKYSRPTFTHDFNASYIRPSERSYFTSSRAENSSKVKPLRPSRSRDRVEKAEAKVPSTYQFRYTKYA